MSNVKNSQNSRKFVIKLLNRLDETSSYSNLLLNDALEKSRLKPQEKKFASALFYGVLEREIMLDDIIDSMLKNPKNTLSAEVRNILRMGVYQLVFMDSVPDSAAVDESVKLAKRQKNPAVSGFVNGILREFIRRGKPMPKKSSPLEQLSFDYSAPLWLVRKWNKEYGRAICKTMLESSLGDAPTAVKVNTLNFSLNEVVSILQSDDFECEQADSELVKDALIIKGTGSLEKCGAYNAGLFHVQDLSCQLCCKVLDPQENDVIFDICSAPGGKAFTIAELMNNKGRVLAFDLHENRVRLIKQGSERLGLTCINAMTNDGKKVNSSLPQADRVLCDVPCSGLGVIRKKPEIKYKDPKDFERLPEIQYDILSASANYVKAGGILVYSTCTLSKAENEEVVEKFLANHKDFVPAALPEPFEEGITNVTITPDMFGSDGFFIAKFERLR